MKIYKIERKQSDCYYNELCGIVAVANTEEEVRHFAKDMSGDEGEVVWDNTEVQEVGIYTGDEKKPFVLMSDFISP